MNAAQRQVAANLWTKPIGSIISPLIGCQWTTLTIAILLLLSLKADTHFTVERRVKGWVDQGGRVHTEMVYLLADGQSKY